VHVFQLAPLFRGMKFPLRRSRQSPLVRALAIIAALLVSSAGFSGCASQRGADYVSGFAARAPLATIVPRLEVMAAAERAAALHEGDFVLRGTGHSMEPVYVAGTSLVVHPTAMHMLRKGMAVIYTNAAGANVAHMLLEKHERGWLAIGLNNAEPDDVLVTERNLVGVIKLAFSPDDMSMPAAAGAQVAMMWARGESRVAVDAATRGGIGQ
jgi:hypothetical protein